MSDLISRQAAIDAIGEKSDEIYKTKQKGATYPHDDFFQGMAYAENVVKHLPSAQPDEKLEKCRFEYINACRIVTFSTPDTTKKDISDAYAVIKALQPIFGDVTF